MKDLGLDSGSSSEEENKKKDQEEDQEEAEEEHALIQLGQLRGGKEAAEAEGAEEEDEGKRQLSNEQ